MRRDGAETPLAAEKLGKVVGFEVTHQGKTGLDLDSSWGLKDRGGKDHSQAPCGTVTPFAGIEKAEVAHLGWETMAGGVGLGNREFHFGHVTFETLMSHPDGAAGWAVK